ncbi:sugar transferase [Listeria rocourtiae]|uniref:sugar transferase n=1 Tax=Listeria rocourtiae TaxID=647910 RepID=UPI0016285855|nr:sugar transferase [Listeria rocourtiae]MBC1435118.1 sugar transferase [Listeria rocourtiae]
MKPNMYLKIKKKSDCVISLLALALLSPILIIIMLVTKLSNLHAPVFFKQKRVGEDGHLFYMYKFRTMHVDAEAQLDHYLKQNEIEGAMFKLRNDPRVTKIGRILRKTSLDELPQLWNVIKGDMALVGPRPPLPREVAEYTTHDKKRLSIIPGCTGLWQVSGRNELSFQEMVELDLQYIQQVSFKLDAKIIGKTVLVILIPKGAY